MTKRPRYLASSVRVVTTPAFTLIELVVSMSIMSILLVAMSSAIVLATHALPDSTSPGLATIKTTYVLNDLASELRYAVAFSERTAIAVTFTVADRDNPPDSTDETIRWAWSGTSGDPLTRQYNAGAVVTVAQDIYEFDLIYNTKVVQEQIPTEVTSASVLFHMLTTGPTLQEKSVKDNRWYGQYFQPTGFNQTQLPADAISWSIETVAFRARQAGIDSGGTTWATLHPAAPQYTPDTLTVLEQVMVSESSLPASTAPFTLWYANFSSVTGLAPGQGVCFVLTSSDLDDALETQCHEDINVPNTGLLESGGDNIWQFTGTTAGLRNNVYGRYVTPGPPQIVNHTFLTMVRAALQIGSLTASRVDTATPILNQSEITP